jgi:DNA-binding response OmpR family regulator
MMAESRDGRRKAVRHPSNVPVATAGSLRILVVQHNGHYGRFLRNHLEIQGFGVDIASDGATALQVAARRLPTLIILDTMLPTGDGYQILERLKGERPDLPIVVLTARRDEQAMLRAFGLGVDDYLTKPVGILELLARIRAVLRRVVPGYDRLPMSIRLGHLAIHPPTRTVTRNGRDVPLRPKEYDLLLALVREQGRIVSRAELLRDVWGYNVDTISRTVDTHLAGLRQKLELDPVHPEYLITVRTAGYMVRRPESPQG